MRGFRIKPNEKDIDLSNLDPAQIEYLGDMSNINQIIARRRGIEWKQSIQDDLDKDFKVYFLVKKNMEYNVFYGPDIDNYIKNNNISLPLVKSDKARKCIEHFIKSLN